jgi:hypothetical protein
MYTDNGFTKTGSGQRQIGKTQGKDTLFLAAYRGDVCTSVGSLYTNDGPPPNASDSSECLPASETGKYFHPTEMHGVTMQEGPDGNSPLRPTYWFWHDWACAGNVSGCPWVGA